MDMMDEPEDERNGKVASRTLASAMPNASNCRPENDSPSTSTPTRAALMGNSTVNMPPCAAGTAFRPVIQSQTVHIQAASA